LVSPIESVINVLRDGGDRLGVSVIASGGGTSALCSEYGVLYHHEFPRKDGMVIFSSENIDRCRSKLSYKFEQFRKTSSKHRTLFVRGGIGTDLAADKASDGVVSASVLNGLAGTLAALSQRSDFSVAVVLRRGINGISRSFNEHISEDEPLDKRVVPILCEVTPEWPAGGDPKVFGNVFREFGLTEETRITEDDTPDSPAYG
jgi:hypothetical protein